jgi:hypothetical protein
MNHSPIETINNITNINKLFIVSLDLKDEFRMELK